MKTIDPQATQHRKDNLRTLCDADSYLPAIEACLDPEQTKKLRIHHMANFMALSAELFLTNYHGIAEAFDRNNGLELVFKAKLAQEKDNVELQYKPVDTYKDSASANLPIEEDPNQPELFPKKKPAPAAEEAGPTVDVESAPLGLPAPVMGLPAPELTPEERARIESIRQAGIDARAAGHPISANPHPAFSIDRAIWSQGWKAGTAPADQDAPEAPEAPPEKPKKRGRKKPAEDPPAVDAEIIEPAAGSVEILDNDDEGPDA